MYELHTGERLCIAVLAALGVTLAAIYLPGTTTILWQAFVGDFALFGAFVVAGMGLRAAGRAPRLSATLIALGIFPIYSSLLALINALQFPLAAPLIDPLLIRIDQALGHDWAASVAWLAGWPRLSLVLAYAYVSAVPLLLLLMLALGLTGRVPQMHRMLLTGMAAGMMTVAFAVAFPSFGPSAFMPVAPETAAAARLVVGNDYGALLLRLGETGFDPIGAHLVLGSIAFPSFHIVMALLLIWFARGTALGWPLLAVGALMFPATVLHGGHYAVDLAGGAAVFGLALALTGRLVPARAADQVITSGAMRPVRARMPASASTAAATPASAA